jgi:hypothetical protein
MWWKLLVAIAVDGFDFLVGRFLFPVPYAGELIGTVVAVYLFGWKGLFYLLEAIDPTEQVDAFVPTCTIIALAVMREERARAAG